MAYCHNRHCHPSALIKEVEPATPQADKKGEGDMANGSLRSDQSHTSDMSPSSLIANNAKVTKPVEPRTRTFAAP